MSASTSSTPGGPGPDRHDPQALYRAFRGRFTTPVAWTMGVALVVGCTLIAFFGTAPGTHDLANQISTIGIGLLLGAITIRFAAVRADPDPEGVRVVNYLRGRYLRWAEIVAVRFAPGDPWVHLDLTDGSVLAVMAIQRSDGKHAMAEAARLVSLISQHGEGREPDAAPGHRGG